MSSRTNLLFLGVSLSLSAAVNGKTSNSEHFVSVFSCVFRFQDNVDFETPEGISETDLAFFIT